MRFGPWPRNILIAGAGIIGVAWTVALAALLLPAVPSFQKIHEQYRPSDSWIVDRDGVPLESIREAKDRRMLDWTAWAEVSPIFRRQLVAVEDHRFFRHPGVDPLALAQAAVNTAGRRGRRGASTITMQLVHLLPSLKTRAGTGGIFSALARKLRQMGVAIKLETTWRKEEILEAYVNLIPFRGELVGLRAASFGLFAKAPSALNEIESALLIASIRSPNAPIVDVVRRACAIAPQSNCNTLRELAEGTLGKPYRLARERERVPVLARVFVRNPLAGLIPTTLVSAIQGAALEAVREQLTVLKDRNVHDAAVIVLDTKTGTPLAYVGNGGPEFSSAAQIDGVSMRRQAGSTLKPFVYATAFDLRYLAMNSLVEDAAEDFAVGGGGVYSPRDYDPLFQGNVSAAEALASSLNVPAVRTLILAKESRVLDRLRALGFTDLKEDDHYGPSLALGTVDVTLYELAQAYRQLSLFSDAKVFGEATKRQIFSSLARPEYRRYTFGLDSVLALPFPAAVKTGTSKDLRDNWCLGFTSQYTVGVWVGNFDGSSMWNVSGLTGAAPIWRKLMIALHPSPPRDEVMDYVPAALPLLHPALTKIRYPQRGMLVGLDPDIPSHLQKLPIQIDHPQRNQRIFVDGHVQGRAQKISLWAVAKGKHRVELRAGSGAVVDHVEFVVR